MFFDLALLSNFLTVVFGVLLGVSFSKSQRAKYPFLRILDGRQLTLVVALIIFAFLSITFSVLDKRQESETSREIQAHAFERLSRETHSFLNLLSRMIAAGSDGWLPRTKKEFFSRRSVDLICHQLNGDSKAPVIPHRTWRVWFGQETSEYRKSLATILAEQGPQLDASSVRAISEAQQSALLWLPAQLQGLHEMDLQKGTQRPPLLCHGLEDSVEESFDKLAVLQDEVERGEERYRLIKSEGWRAFPFPKDDSSVGRDHFSREDLARWHAAHPYAPSGEPPKN